LEAVSQKKINLLDLEGISEVLSSIGNSKVWTIVIAQEKLNDVINNSNIRSTELTKVTDRFKTKIHLSSEEVDYVIKKRLLLKEEKFAKKLKEYFSKESGSIIDFTNLRAAFPTKSENIDDFIIYYPFHKYQFQLLANFLFTMHQKAKTGGTERGMIITAHSILKSIKDNKLFSFVTSYNLTTHGQKNAEGELIRKYTIADKIIQENNISVSGTNLLKTIYFLTESNLVACTSENVIYLKSTAKNFMKSSPLLKKH